MRTSRLLSLLLLSLFVGCSAKQALMPLCKTPHFEMQDTVGYETKNRFQQDFLYIVQCLEYRHPDMYHVIPEDRFELKKAEMLRYLEGVEDELDFQLAMQKFLAGMKDAHTYFCFFDLFESDEVFPVEFTWIGDRLYIANAGLELDESLIGQEVVRIASMDVDDFFQEAACFFSAENEVSIRNMLELYMTRPEFYYRAGFIGTGDRLDLTVLHQGVERAIVLFKTDGVDWHERDTQRHPITGKRDAKFDYSIYEEYDLAYLQFNQCIDRAVGLQIISDIPWYIYYPILGPILLVSYPVVWCKQWCFGYHPYFSDLLEDLFEEIDERGIGNLVVDVRYNSGGASILGNQLLYFLNTPKKIEGFKTYNFVEYRKRDAKEKEADDLFAEIRDEDSSFYIPEPEKRFDGKVYVIIGSDTASSATDFATLMSDNRLCVTVGQPTAQQPTSFGDSAFFCTPNTKNIISVSWKYFERPDHSKNGDVSLYPDVEIYPTIDDILNGKDPVFDWIVKDIQEPVIES